MSRPDRTPDEIIQARRRARDPVGYYAGWCAATAAMAVYSLAWWLRYGIASVFVRI